MRRSAVCPATCASTASWGTDRGRIWAFAARFYDSLPPVQKLFGAGSGALFHADAARPLFSDASLDTAHNEYLQYLRDERSRWGCSATLPRSRWLSVRASSGAKRSPFTALWSSQSLPTRRRLW